MASDVPTRQLREEPLMTNSPMSFQVFTMVKHGFELSLLSQYYPKYAGSIGVHRDQPLGAPGEKPSAPWLILQDSSKVGELGPTLELHGQLVGGDWNMAFMTFHSVGNVMTPTDFHSIIFQRGRAQPPTRIVVTCISNNPLLAMIITYSL